MHKTPTGDSGPPAIDPTLSMQNRLRLTARVAVSVSLVGSIVLMVTLYFLLTDQPQENYYQIIQSLTRSKDRLMLAMFVAGTLIVLTAGLITWIITLYSSHRVAGPLYRFSRNIELEIERGPVATTSLRKGDSFQELSDKLGMAADGLSDYYAQQLRAVDELSRNLDAEQPCSVNQYRDLLQKIKTTLSGGS